MFHAVKISADTTTSDELATGIAYIVDASGGSITLTLSDKLNDGATFFVKKQDDSDNIVTVRGETTLIDNCEQADLLIKDEAIMLVKHPDGWQIL